MSIDSVGKTLVNLLRTKLGHHTFDHDDLPTPEVGINIHVASPAEAADLDAQITLFLYDVMESESLKNRPWVERDQGRKVERVRPPLTLDLLYMLTVYSPRDDSDSEKAHRYLSDAMRVFHENGVLSDSQLIGDFPNKEQLELHVTMKPISMEDLTRIWSIFPNVPYQTSVCYLVTPVEIESKDSITASRVLDKQSRYESKERAVAEVNE